MRACLSPMSVSACPTMGVPSLRDAVTVFNLRWSRVAKFSLRMLFAQFRDDVDDSAANAQPAGDSFGAPVVAASAGTCVCSPTELTISYQSMLNLYFALAITLRCTAAVLVSVISFVHVAYCLGL